MHVLFFLHRKIRRIRSGQLYKFTALLSILKAPDDRSCLMKPMVAKYSKIKSCSLLYLISSIAKLGEEEGGGWNYPFSTYLRGAWRDRDTNDIFAHCSLIFHFLDFKFPTLFVLLNFILWSGLFFNSFRKNKKFRKTAKNALASA